MTMKKLTELYIYDLRKPDIDRFERADIIRKYMKDNKLSYDKMCEQFGIKKSTLFGWLMYGQKITEKQYNDLKDSGLTETQIFNRLKKKNFDTVSTKDLVEEFNIKFLRSDLDALLQISARVLSKVDKISNDIDIDDITKIKDTINNINRLLMKVENNGRIKN